MKETGTEELKATFAAPHELRINAAEHDIVGIARLRSLTALIRRERACLDDMRNVAEWLHIPLGSEAQADVWPKWLQTIADVYKAAAATAEADTPLIVPEGYTVRAAIHIEAPPEQRITSDQAKAAALRLINSHFHNPDGARCHIPAQRTDDDILLMDYLNQVEA